ncbi:Uncharacterised protein [Bordetella pertussis]|nr:Uncharacterised protein [Bordetella pertussis]
MGDPHWRQPDSCSMPPSKNRTSIQARVKLSTGSAASAGACSRYRRYASITARMPWLEVRWFRNVYTL